MKGIHPELF